MKKPILIPIGVAERMTSFKPENRLLCAVGQFSPKRKNFWYPVQSYFLTEQSINEANTFLGRLTRTVLHNDAAMRRFCAANPDAKQPDYWCPTYDFAYFGKINNYRLRCMCNHGDFNYMLMVYLVYQKNRSYMNRKAA